VPAPGFSWVRKPGKEKTMYTVSDLTEIGTAEDLILATKMQDFSDDMSVPSDLPSEQFDE
jgi:hypothetical protein